MIIKTEKLTKYYGKTPGIINLSLEVDKGEIFGFLGPNGTGKTTTIRCMMDFLRPTSGKIKILGLDAQKDSVVLKKKIAYLSSDIKLYDYWTGADHINFIQGIRKDSNIASELIKKLNFNPQINFKNLSSGNKQKLALILTLMSEPEVLILDEPTLGLDPLLQNTIYEILRDLQNKGRTIFMSSHNLHEVEEICTRVAIIKDNRLMTTENIMDLKKKRLYSISIYFEGEFAKKDFQIPGSQFLEDLAGNGIKLSHKGNLNPLIKKISQYPIKDLEISRASLEEIFLEFYRKGN